MFGPTGAAAAAQPSIEACRSRMTSAACHGMTVDYLTAADEPECSPLAGRIQVLIPGDDAMFEASLRRSGAACRTTLMRGPRIAIVPADGPHAAYRPRRSDLLLISLDPTFFRETILRALGGQAPDIVEPYTGEDAVVREIGNALLSEFRSGRLPSPLYLECWARVITIHLASTYGARRSTLNLAPGLPRRKLDEVLSFIEKHLGDSIQIGDLARTVSLSPYHFARMFKQAVGQSPHLYLTARRIRRAEEMLRSSELPLVEIAACVGFQTQAHFTGVFRRHAGVTPRAYRLQNSHSMDARRLWSGELSGVPKGQPAL